MLCEQQSLMLNFWIHSCNVDSCDRFFDEIGNIHIIFISKVAVKIRSPFLSVISHESLSNINLWPVLVI